uniref:Uncharacterized protein n=1 Tax=viral metagenome TaxID=1070528 RepID=A0A6M3K4W3_9ZZZZ
MSDCIFEGISIEEAIAKIRGAYIAVETLALTKESVAGLLAAHRIKRNSNDWADYSKAKEIIFGDAWLKECSEYEQIIKWIANYLQV